MRLQECGLTLKKKKCAFFQKKITYLGFDISEESIHKTNDKIDKVKNAKQPETTQQLLSFLGFVNFYACFIPERAKLLNPLYKCVKEKKFKWT